MSQGRSGNRGNLAAWAVATLLLLGAAAELDAAIPASERNALIAFFEAAEGANWTDSTGWLGAPGTECEWFGLTCSEDGSTITRIRIPLNNLGGVLSHEILKLPNLTDLYLGANPIGGTIPQDIGNLSKLVLLDLSETGITGSLPASIGNLTALENLTFYATALTGPLPDSIGNLSSLQFILLFNNDFEGPIPASLGNLGKLRELYLDNNRLTGPIPATFNQLLSLERLHLSGNQFSGSLPDVGNLANLIEYRANSNQLTGPIPASIGDLTQLRHLDFQGNGLEGTIPDAIGNLGNLEILDLAINELSGPIPASLMELDNLVSLSLSSNALEGPIPPDIGSLSKLVILSLDFNRLSGTIPSSIGMLSELEYLALSGNQLTGEIPPQLTGLSRLDYLDLSANMLTGGIPAGLGDLPAIRSIALSVNQLGGPIPPELGNATTLETIDVSENQLTGTIPATFRNLKNLRVLIVYGNRLTGTIPDWIGELTELRMLMVGGNRLEGTIPQSITQLTALETFDTCGNRITGPIPAAFGNLQQLQYLTLCENLLDGPIPSSFWTLANLIEIRLEDNQLEGTLPPEIRNLANAEVLLLGINSIGGQIPPEIGELDTVTVLSLRGNRFEGAIPPELADMERLEFLGLDQNNLRGEIPAAILGLDTLADGGLNLSYNALYTTNAQVRSFINQKQTGGDFEETQTVAPAGGRIAGSTDRSVTVAWNPIRFFFEAGGYEASVFDSAGALVAVSTTSRKDDESVVVRELLPETAYTVEIRTTTHPHGFQQNLVRSDPTSRFSFTTGPRVVSPPIVDAITRPGAIFQIAGNVLNGTSYTLENFGDLPTTVTLLQAGDFFTQMPATFVLEPGARQEVTIVGLPQAPGSYFGTAIPTGEGVVDDLFLDVQMLSVGQVAGTAVAEPTSSRIALNGQPGSTSIGTVTFRNRGDATLSGVLVSDVPWIETPPSVLTIGPGDLLAVNFTVDRSKRPDLGTTTLTGTLRLLYLSAGGSSSSKTAFDPNNTPPGVSTTLVTIVDTQRNANTGGATPPLVPGEVAIYFPGSTSLGNRTVDFAIAKAFGASSVDDLRLYFKLPGAGGSPSIAAIGSLPTTRSVSFVSAVESTFGQNEVSGSFSFRTERWSDLITVGTIRTSAELRSWVASIPPLRSDRSLGPGERAALTGFRGADPAAIILYVQETRGNRARPVIDAFAPDGTLLGRIALDSIGPFENREVTNLPSGTASIIITVDDAATGGISAWARIEDANGNVRAVADWNLIRGFDGSIRSVIPLTLHDGGEAERRRGVRHRGAGSDSIAIAASAELTQQTVVDLFNPSDEERFVRLRYRESGSSETRDHSLTLAPMQSLRLEDVVATVFARRGSRGQIIVEPDGGAVAIDARVSSGDGGYDVPVLGRDPGLRLGQSVTIAGLEDPALASRETAIGSASGFVLIETTGQPVTVRTTVRLIDGRLIGSVQVRRTFTLQPWEILLAEDLGRAIIGPQRDALLGDLHDVQLQIEVISGDGAVVAGVLERELSTGDQALHIP